MFDFEYILYCWKCSSKVEFVLNNLFISVNNVPYFTEVSVTVIL